MSLNEMEFAAQRLRTKIKTAKRQDHFFDAEKYQAELEVLESQIKEHNEE